MHKRVIKTVLVILAATWIFPVIAQHNYCFESRKTIGKVPYSLSEIGEANIHCSDKADAVLWWRDPFAGTVAMPEMSEPWGFNSEQAVIKPIAESLMLYQACGLACHNGSYPPPSSNNTPRRLLLHTDLVPDAANFQHGKGAIWCLDCHHPTERKSLVDNFGNTVHINSAAQVCGKCHGEVYSNWREGIHGKVIGGWQSNAKKRWFGCSECHNPHDVVNGEQQSGFAAIEPEAAP